MIDCERLVLDYMRTFVVTVNGVPYQVSVEEVAQGAAPVAAPVAPAIPVAPAAPAAPVAPAAPAAPAAAQGSAGSTVIKAPMPGTILKVNYAVGAAVKKGDVLCVLEAMKMENDICAPADGTVASVNVIKGASVATDDVLLTLN